MSICLRDIYEETKDKYELKLLAGEGGLHQEMNWVYVAEDNANASFLRTGELIISTGALYDHTEKWLLQLVRTLWSRHTCGLILNVGKNIFEEDITENVRKFCSSHDFPLFIMPWHIHIYDITRDYYDRIFVDARTEDTIDFYKLLFEIKNPGLLEKFVDQKLGRLLDHDKKHNSDLADTLYLYLKHWGSIQDIAAESYCHRNTVTNRIHILTEQLGYDLVDSQQRFELMTAFMIREFNKLQKKT